MDFNISFNYKFCLRIKNRVKIRDSVFPVWLVPAPKQNKQWDVRLSIAQSTTRPWLSSEAGVPCNHREGLECLPVSVLIKHGNYQTEVSVPDTRFKAFTAITKTPVIVFYCMITSTLSDPFRRRAPGSVLWLHFKQWAKNTALLGKHKQGGTLSPFFHLPARLPKLQAFPWAFT